MTSRGHISLKWQQRRGSMIDNPQEESSQISDLPTKITKQMNKLVFDCDWRPMANGGKCNERGPNSKMPHRR